MLGSTNRGTDRGSFRRPRGSWGRRRGVCCHIEAEEQFAKRKMKRRRNLNIGFKTAIRDNLMFAASHVQQADLPSIETLNSLSADNLTTLGYLFNTSMRNASALSLSPSKCLAFPFETFPLVTTFANARGCIPRACKPTT